MALGSVAVLCVDQPLEQSGRTGNVDVDHTNVVGHRVRQNRETMAANRSGAEHDAQVAGVLEQAESARRV